MLMTTEASQKLISDLKMLATDTQELIRATAEHSGEKVSAARDKARVALAQAQARVAATEAALATRANVAARNADRYVTAHPWATAGVVGLCALALGMLIARR
jgi:ElaB/YqjD/DUF883 family membrane-anchored ribosome-binding protein